MIVSFTKEELRVLNVWGGNTISGGHWGDGNFMLGEESDLLKKIQQNGSGEFDLNPLEVRVLEFWREDNHKQSGNMTGNASAASLAEKITQAYSAIEYDRK